jgi:hypothetical protein
MTNLIFKDPSCKKIAVRLSGGPDSALIYYVLCDYYKDQSDVELFPYTMSSPLRPHSIKWAKKIVEFTGNKTGKWPTKHYHLHHEEHNANNDQDTNLFEYTNGQEILEHQVNQEQNIHIRYTGLSMNCPASELEKFVESLPYNRAMKYYSSIETRARDRDTFFDSRIRFLTSYYSFLPLVNVDKREVKKLYDSYNLTKTLFPLTWSCEHSTQNQHENPKHCGSCYFCLEREFAFGKL